MNSIYITMEETSFPSETTPFPDLPSSFSTTGPPSRCSPEPTPATEPNNIRVYKAERAAQARGRKLPDSVVELDQKIDTDKDLMDAVHAGIDFLRGKGFRIHYHMVRLAVAVYAERNMEFPIGTYDVSFLPAHLPSYNSFLLPVLG
ncbi:hypothetical protein SI65_10251 [Aspergillus cristatus]|uniref:Uncharacterized protein n=1 Tax=Aspergillus cristatus TaxID=573508 RepID=A0A1E3B078_ASPCR|nr:hypothetical protein SI65_10251 [Aspergillus cristatus]